MENRKRALGKGLEQLFNNENLDLSSVEERVYKTASVDEIIELPLSDMRPNPYQPRVDFDQEAINDLANSIMEHGVFQPIIVKKSIKGYEIVAGERRVRASKLAGLETIPAIIRNFNDEQMMEIALLENLQRENLNAIEEATAYQNLMSKLYLTHDELSKKVGKSRSHITNIIGLLKLPKEVQQMINNKLITMGHARVLSKLDNSNDILEIANKIIDERMPVRLLENEVSNNNYEKRNKIERKEESKTKEFYYVEEIMSDKLDAKVKIRDNKILISFSNVADLNRILEIINIKE